MTLGFPATAAERLKDMRKYGTARMVQAAEHIGSSPLQNWKYPHRWEEGAAKLSGPAQVERGIILRPYFCDGCVIGCGNTIHVKGLSIPAHDPRAYNGLACSYATSNRGAHHTSGQTHLYEHRLKVPELNHEPMGRFEVDGKGALAAWTQNIMNVLDSVKSCKFAQNGGWTMGPVSEGFRLVTGREESARDLIALGEKSFNLKRLINVDRGVDRAADTLPKRMLTLAKTADGYTPNLPPLKRMLDEYYETRGWSVDGIPLKETIERLQLP